MWLLGQKQNELWWHKQDKSGSWVPVSQEEADAQNQYWKNQRDEIAAKIFNDHFNKENK